MAAAAESEPATLAIPIKQQKHCATAAPKCFDDILQLINPRGRWQLFTLIQCVLSYIAVGLSSYGQAIFLIGRMDATCVAYADGTTPTQHWLLLIHGSNNNNNITARPNGTTISRNGDIGRIIDTKWLSAHRCKAPRGSGSKCSQWNYTSPYYTNTMQSEWNLVCDNAYKVPLFQACYQIGYMFGMPIVGNLADRLGRRGTVWLAWPFLVAGYTVMSQAPYYWLAAAMRVVQGTLFGSYWNAKLILNMELTVPDKRNMVSVAVNCTWPVAAILISLMAYYIRNWRWLQLLCIAPVVAVLPLIALLPESPRWLATRSQFRRAERTLKRGARINRRQCPESTELLLALDPAASVVVVQPRVKQVDENQQNTVTKTTCEESIKRTNPQRGILAFVAHRQLRHHTLLLFIQWFVAALVFYGIMFYGTGVLPGSPQLKFGLMAIARLLACPVQLVIFNRFGAKLSLVVLSMLTAVSLLAIGLLPPAPPSAVLAQSAAASSFWNTLFPAGTMSATAAITIALLMLGNCLIDACFAAVYIVTGTVYPTEMRQTGFSLCSTLAGIGSALSPFAAGSLGLWWRPLPAFVFAGACAVASLAALLLPDDDNDMTAETQVPAVIDEKTGEEAQQQQVTATPPETAAASTTAKPKTAASRQPSTASSRQRYNVVMTAEAMCGGTTSMSPDLAVGGHLMLACRDEARDRIIKRERSKSLQTADVDGTAAPRRTAYFRRFSARLTQRKPDIHTMRAAAAAVRAKRQQRPPLVHTASIMSTTSRRQLESIQDVVEQSDKSEISWTSASSVSSATPAPPPSSGGGENLPNAHTDVAPNVV